MDIFGGRVLLLNNAIEVDGFSEVYLLQESSGWNWEEKCKIDLGRKRIIHVERESYLIFVNGNSININKIEFPDRTDFSEDPNGIHHPMIRIVEYLKNKGIKSKTLPVPLKELKRQYRNGMFSVAGYYLQDSSWCDCWTYACDMYLIENQLVIGGKSIKSFSVSHSSWISTDVKSKMGDIIQKVLSEPVAISEQDFDRLLEERGMKDIYHYFSVEYYE